MVLVLQMNKPTKRVDPARERWKRLMKDIDAMVDRNGCWDAKHDAGIAPHYVRGPLSEGQLETETVYYTLDDAKRVTGFLMARWTGREMKTIAVCSEATAAPGTGKAIVLHSLADARLRQKQQASLRALPHVFGYYARFGYARSPINAKGTNIDGYLHTKNLRNTVNWRAAPGTQTPGTQTPGTQTPVRAQSPARARSRSPAGARSRSPLRVRTPGVLESRRRDRSVESRRLGRERR